MVGGGGEEDMRSLIKLYLPLKLWGLELAKILLKLNKFLEVSLSEVGGSIGGWRAV